MNTQKFSTDNAERRRASSPPHSSTFGSDTSPVNSPPRRFSSPIPSIRSYLYSDRFIPSRVSSNFDEAFDMVENSELNTQNESHENQGTMSNLLRYELLGQPIVAPKGEMGDPTSTGEGALSSPGVFNRPTQNVLKFTSPRDRRSMGGERLSVLDSIPNFAAASPSRQRAAASPKKPTRKISKAPYKVLDAPLLQDDYYLNLVDWSSSNVLAVALGSAVYLWSACTSKVSV